MSDIDIAKTILFENGYTCVFCKNTEILTTNDRGIKPLITLITNNTFLDGYSVADKVVGKAAALLYAFLHAKEIYADTISEQACSVLEKNNIKFNFSHKVPFIINRAKTGKCIMESAVWDIEEPHEAVSILIKKLSSLD